MLRGGVAACQGMVCVPLAVLSATDQLHSTQLTVHTPYLDMLPHHRTTYNDLVFTES